MTTKVTIQAEDKTAYVYTAPLTKDLDGEFTLAAELTDEEQTFYVHDMLDLMVTENKLG